MWELKQGIKVKEIIYTIFLAIVYWFQINHKLATIIELW